MATAIILPKNNRSTTPSSWSIIICTPCRTRITRKSPRPSGVLDQPYRARGEVVARAVLTGVERWAVGAVVGHPLGYRRRVAPHDGRPVRHLGVDPHIVDALGLQALDGPLDEGGVLGRVARPRRVSLDVEPPGDGGVHSGVLRRLERELGVVVSRVAGVVTVADGRPRRLRIEGQVDVEVETAPGPGRLGSQAWVDVRA